MSKKQQVNVGVKRGGGPPPGYRWNVGMIDFVHDEVMGFLSPAQYQHIAMQVKELAREVDPTHSSTASVDSIEEFYELRDKGGILGKKNVRIFFGIDKKSSAIIILGGIKKENDGPTPAGDKVTMRRRWRKYKSGDYGQFNP